MDLWFSEDFRGNKSLLIHLNLPRPLHPGVACLYLLKTYENLKFF